MICSDVINCLHPNCAEVPADLLFHLPSYICVTFASYFVNSSSYVFNFRCQHGVLNVCYTAGELEKYNGSGMCEVENWQNQPFISLREAARKQAPWNPMLASVRPAA